MGYLYDTEMFIIEKTVASAKSGEAIHILHIAGELLYLKKSGGDSAARFAGRRDHCIDNKPRHGKRWEMMNTR